MQILARPEGNHSSTSARAGAIAMLPVLAALAPYGVAVGAAGAESGVGDHAALASALFIYGAAAQLTTLELIDQGAAFVVVLVTVLLVNLRLAAYGAAMARHWQSAPRWWQALASYLLVDPSFLLGSAEAEKCPESHHRPYYLGAAATLWVGWLAANVAGLLAGDGVAAVLPTDLLVQLVLLGMLVTAVSNNGSRRVATVAVVGGAIGVALPLGLGLVAGAGAGIAVGARRHLRYGQGESA
jgi:predicted branched-subunit amino acid permease